MSAIDPATDAGTQSAFEQALAREVLLTERLRAGILAGLLALALLAFGVIVTVFPNVLLSVFRGRLQFSLVIAILVPAIGFELLTRIAVGRYLQARRAPPAIGRYLNAFVEISLPTLLLVIAAGIFGGPQALVSPPAALYFLFIVVSTLHLDFALSVFTGLVAAGEYMALAVYYLGPGNPAAADPLLGTLPPQMGRAVIFLVTGVVAGLVALQIRRQFAHSIRTVQERNRVLNIFGQHVSPEVVQKLLAQEVDLGGEVRHVCLMFLDIRDFTTFAEKRDPEAVVRYLNLLFEFMIEAVNRHHGIVNKFLGDGFMAAFGAPFSDGRDVHNAVAAALEIIARVETLNAAQTIPPTRVGIGLHAGQAVTGNVGSVQRKEYTIIGDVVNLASRVEQLNKTYNSRLLVSEAVWEAIRSDYPAAEALGAAQVKGHEALINIYKLA
jgi:adenylate cyclase